MRSAWRWWLCAVYSTGLALILSGPAAAELPDFSITKVEISNLGDPGDWCRKATVRVSVRNSGATVTAPVPVQLDAEYPEGPRSITKPLSGGIPAGEVRTVGITINVASSLALKASVDPTKQFKESDETNNDLRTKTGSIPAACKPEVSAPSTPKIMGTPRIGSCNTVTTSVGFQPNGVPTSFDVSLHTGSYTMPVTAPPTVTKRINTNGGSTMVTFANVPLTQSFQIFARGDVNNEIPEYSDLFSDPNRSASISGSATEPCPAPGLPTRDDTRDRR